MNLIKKRVFALLVLLSNTLLIYASNYVDDSEWNDGESTSIGNLLRVALVVGAVIWIVYSIINRKKNKQE